MSGTLSDEAAIVAIENARLGIKISDEIKRSGAPDLHVVFRGNVDPELQRTMLDALKDRGNRAYFNRTAFDVPEEIWALHETAATPETLSHWENLRQYRGHDIAVFARDHFGLYCPRSGGMPLTAKDVVVVTAPNYPVLDKR